MQLVVHIDEPWQKESVEQITRRFEASNPGVKILVKVVPSGEIRTALFNGESDADLVQLFNGDIVDCSRNELLLDLNIWLRQNQELKSLFHPSIFRLAETEGRVAVLPLSASMKGIFYNKQWFDKAGIPYPLEGWTWNDFEEIAVRLQRVNVREGDGRFAARISFHHEYMGLLLLTAGTDWLSPDRKRASGYTNSVKSVQAVTWAADLVRKHQVAGATQAYFLNSDLLRNESGMILDYYNMLHEFQPHLKDDLGVAGLPFFDEGNRVNEPWVCGFGISSKTGNSELAWSLLCELTCTSNELTRLVTEGSIAPLRSVYSEAGHDRDPLRNTILAELANSAQLPVSAGNIALYALLDQYVNPALARIVFEGADVKETLDDLAIVLDGKLQD
ncbi:extracellular solute-binding protein [Paenibacillus sp. NPDC058174]|uniref:extracellular solute-binding protein n=1 Tax=Paenibacillus sp. NPDC058174 TaxID=3346366 RepID=UPI0036DCA16D